MTVPFGKVRVALAFLFVVLAVNFMAAQKIRDGGQAMAPDGAGHGVHAVAPSGNTVTLGNGINYNGGPVMKANPVPIYIIWYGSWTNGPKPSDSQATVSLIEHYIGSLGNTPYELINSTYGDTTGNVSGNVSFAGHFFDTGSQGTKLSDAKVQTVVSTALSNGSLPRDTNALYFVLTSSNISESSGFCTRYCGWHTHATLGGADIKYSFVGNVDRCPSGCEIQTTGPNSPATGVGGADGMINVMSHEQEEAISDPDLNAWFDSSGQENGDKCNFNFGATQTCAAGSLCTAAADSAGAKFNQTFGNNDWMIQQNWENAAGGACVQHL